MTDRKTLFLSVPAISKLLSLDRTATFRRVQNGDFGQPIKHGRAAYVPLAAIETFAGCAISDEQIDHAGAGYPHRFINIVAPEAA